MLTHDEIKSVIARLGELDPDLLADDALLTDLMVDSFAMVDLCIALQEEMDVIFTGEDLGEVSTVGDLIRLVAARAEPAARRA